jgi:hypothetical protein
MNVNALANHSYLLPCPSSTIASSCASSRAKFLRVPARRPLCPATLSPLFGYFLFNVHLRAPIHHLIAMDIPADIIEHMNAGAFQSLCEHLKARSDLVQNMTLMTISGFCRNCLAKWMVLEARKLSKQLNTDDKLADRLIQEGETCQDIVHALNKWGYEDAAKIVYGCTYDLWKKRHQTKPTEEQL